MPRKWAYILIFTVFTLVILSAWEIYKAFEKEKDVGEYRIYATSMSRDFDVDLLEDISKLQSEILVKSMDITPGTGSLD